MIRCNAARESSVLIIWDSDACWAPRKLLDGLHAQQGRWFPLEYVTWPSKRFQKTLHGLIHCHAMKIRVILLMTDEYWKKNRMAGHEGIDCWSVRIHESSWITLDRISSHLPPRIAIQGKEDLGCAGDRRCDLWCQSRHICRWDHPTFQPEGCLLWSTLAAVDYLQAQHFVYIWRCTYACPTAGHPVPNFRGSLGRTLPDVLQEL